MAGFQICISVPLNQLVNWQDTSCNVSVIILAIDHRRHSRQSPYITILGYLKLLKMLLQQYRSLSLKYKYGQSLEYEDTYINNFT